MRRSCSKSQSAFSHDQQKCEKMISTSLTAQCRTCCKLGHPSQLCKEDLPTCSICSGRHSRDAHRCGNQGCVKGGNDKPVPDCCETIPLKCPNCGDKHTASFPGCPVKAEAINALKIRTNRVSSSPADPVVPVDNDTEITDAAHN